MFSRISFPLLLLAIALGGLILTALPRFRSSRIIPLLRWSIYLPALISLNIAWWHLLDKRGIVVPNWDWLPATPLPVWSLTIGLLFSLAHLVVLFALAPQPAFKRDIKNNDTTLPVAQSFAFQAPPVVPLLLDLAGYLAPLALLWSTAAPPPPQFAVDIAVFAWAGVGVVAAVGWRTLLLMVVLFRQGAASPSAMIGDRRRTVAIFAVTLALYIGLILWPIHAVEATGDEPAYLLLTHSLVYDGDFDLANNFAARDYSRAGWYVDQWGPYGQAISTPTGYLAPLHDPGLSILLVPGYALAGRLGATLTIAFFAALAATLIYPLLRLLGYNPTVAALSWLALMLGAPLVLYSGQLYAEVPGAVLLTLAIYLAITLQPGAAISLTRLFCLSLTLALLPWFNIRFWFFFPPIVLYVFIRYLVYLRRLNNRERIISFALAFVVPLIPQVVSLAAFALLDSRVYGTWKPNAGYWLYVRPGEILTPSVYSGAAGLLLDRHYGIAPFAPIFLFVIPGLALLLLKRKFLNGPVVLVVGIAILYYLLDTSNTTWYGGYCPPGRYILAIAPCLALPIAEVWQLALATFWRRFAGIFLLIPLIMAVLYSMPVAAFINAIPHTRYTWAEEYRDHDLHVVATFAHQGAFYELLGRLQVPLEKFWPNFWEPQLATWPTTGRWLAIIAVLTLFYAGAVFLSERIKVVRVPSGEPVSS